MSEQPQHPVRRLASAWRARLRGMPAGNGEVDVAWRAGREGQAPTVTVNGETAEVRLDRRDETRAVLFEGAGPEPFRTPVLFGPPATGTDGIVRREIVVDGWRFEVELELEARAALRDRASQLTGAAAGGGRGELRAIIPGKIVAVDVRPGDAVKSGQRLLVVEAMKMQNEFVAPRDGTVERVAVEPGATVERDDLLVVIS